MCIALLSNAHPSYALILLSNRDEYLTRPTLTADYWAPPDSHVLGGRDLERPVRGTWLGITRTGHLAVLTNYREAGHPELSPRSRGAMANAFLTQSPCSFASTADFVRNLTEEGEGLSDVGGFSLICGRIGEPLAVLSNRTPNVDGTKWVMDKPGTTIGLSNTAFGDQSWEKVKDGKSLLKQAIQSDVENRASGDSDFIDALFKILSDDRLPRRDTRKGESWEGYIAKMRKSILVPPINGSDNGVSTHAGDLYGTQKQSVILVTHEGHMTFVERSLYDEGARPIVVPGGDKTFHFDIEGWQRPSGSSS